MPKEDRSQWVAVAPEQTNDNDDLPKVTSAQTAYQIYQKKNSQAIKQDLAYRGEASDLPNLTKAISKSWRNLSEEGRKEYEDEAATDRFRFMKESHMRDVAVMKKQEQLRKERDEIILTGGDGRSTRGARQKEMKKAARAEKKANKKKNFKQIENSDEEEFQSDDESSSDGEFDGEDSDSSSNSDSSKPKKKKKKTPVISAEVLARRHKAKEEKEKKDKYIASRQEDLRTERSDQAKKRLDFLLKQSDIFRHFGDVKEDKAKFYNRGGKLLSPEKGCRTNRRDDIADDVDAEELAQAEEEQGNTVYLTSQPTSLSFGKMRAYQLEGLNWMIRLQENGVNGILADEMGLGKTLQSISVLVYMMEYMKVNGPHLIVVPKSTLSNWMAEFKRWAPTISTIKFHGNKDERENIAKNILQPGQKNEERSWHACVTTYEICNLDKQVLSKFAWSYIIIDEAHRLKNEASAFSRTIRTFEARYRLLLTGTPLQNNLHELWALLNFLVPDVFASAEQFDEWFNLDIDDADEKNKLISQLHKILRPFMLRRLKADVEKSLPPKHETILFTGMSAMQKKLYKDILLRDVNMLQGGNNGSGGQTAILNIVMQLRKCAGHPYLFPGAEDRSLPPLGEHLVENCGKMVLLDKLLVRLKELGHRVLLFTQMTRILDILEDYLVMRQFQYCRIDGNTDYEKREEDINSFNAPGSEKFLFLLSTRAGGLGINLQTADVVILFDSDWNPQADLQAQDRAHRIGQKRPVQVFRLVTEHTIEEKIVERAQQKLKLDAMVVQQGRLKDKDKLSREDLLTAVRFGADKVFKSKDSSITDDDIDLILEAGKKKTQELNDKLQAAEKGDMLDFKLDGSSANMQTYEGIDYSKTDFAQVKAAQEQAELLGILDMGKRERRPVANYNEDQLYRQQVASNQITRKAPKKTKEVRLPKHLRLPRLDEWQMFDREALNIIQEEEEKAFRELSEEMQMILRGKQPVETSSKQPTSPESQVENAEKSNSYTVEGMDGGEENTKPLTIVDVPPLIPEERQKLKDELLSQGFADWGRSHFTAFIKASAEHGRNSFSKIAPEVGKLQSMVEEYAKAFWDENFGKVRFTETEYERSVKRIEQGEKKLHLIKVSQTATRTLVSLFDNPWRELQFTYVNVKDKVFTQEEDRHLLCWAHKYGYGNWNAVKMAIRRSPEFRFDYYLRSLPTEAVGKRCEQLMKAAEKEIELLTKKAREDAGAFEEEKKENSMNENAPVLEVKLPRFKEIKDAIRKQAEEDVEMERKQLEGKVEEIESNIEEIQNRLNFLQKCSKEFEGGKRKSSQTEFPEDLLPELANIVAKSGSQGVMAISIEFVSEYGQPVPKKVICAKIEDIANKEKRKEEGDLRAVWHVLPEYMNLLTVETIRHLRKEKEGRLEKKRGGSRKKQIYQSNEDMETIENGAIGPDGDFVDFPPYDGTEHPRECKKAFTLFCTGTRKKVKKSLEPSKRKERDLVNGILKQKWNEMPSEEKDVWKKWQVWDQLRYNRDLAIHRTPKKSQRLVNQEHTTEDSISDIPNKRKGDDDVESDKPQSVPNPDTSFHIPKKKRT